jgi:hypothetical protein
MKADVVSATPAVIPNAHNVNNPFQEKGHAIRVALIIPLNEMWQEGTPLPAFFIVTSRMLRQ